MLNDTYGKRVGEGFELLDTKRSAQNLANRQSKGYHLNALISKGMLDRQIVFCDMKKDKRAGGNIGLGARRH